MQDLLRRNTAVMAGVWSLEVMPTGAASWRYRYQLHGQDREGIHRTLSRIVGLKEATHEAGRARSRRVPRPISLRGRSSSQKWRWRTATHRWQNSASATYAEVIAKDRKDANPDCSRYLEKEIYPAFGSKPLREVTAQDVQRLVFRKRDNGFPSSAAQLRNLLKRVFDYALVNAVLVTRQTRPHATPTRFITPRSGPVHGPCHRTKSGSTCQVLSRVEYPAAVQARPTHHPADSRSEVRAPSCSLGAHRLRSGRVDDTGSQLEDWQASHHLSQSTDPRHVRGTERTR